MAERRIFTPTELNREVRLHLEAGFPRIWLEAEISNLSRPSSGHLYFSLKDDRAQIRCALFRSAAGKLSLQPENGMKVLAAGRLSLYEPRGDYQLIVDSLQHAGEGLLQQQFEKLKKKLEEEGLFDPARKKALPPYPLRLAIITSPSGAAIRDMLHVLERRWPIAQVRIYPVPVQGDEAPPAIVGAIRAAGRHAWADVILLGRGGGSLEDLWAFNDERVARAIADCPIPLVSAVGHETDFSISDFVADLRAPTPSAAAELSTPDGRALSEQFNRLMRQLLVRMGDRLKTESQRMDHITHRLEQVHPRRRLDDQRNRLAVAQTSLRREIARKLDQDNKALTHVGRQLALLHPRRSIASARERLGKAHDTMRREILAALRHRKDQLAGFSGMLNAVSPLNTVGRGYALLTTEGTEDLVTRTGQVPTDGRITAQVTDGRLFCRVEKTDARKPESLLTKND